MWRGWKTRMTTQNRQNTNAKKQNFYIYSFRFTWFIVYKVIRIIIATSITNSCDALCWLLVYLFSPFSESNAFHVRFTHNLLSWLTVCVCSRYELVHVSSVVRMELYWYVYKTRVCMVLRSFKRVFCFIILYYIVLYCNVNRKHKAYKLKQIFRESSYRLTINAFLV